ncbi:putative D-galacturonate reductase [Helianthus annuus]|uniref:D-galacturonate reductase n=1 Tax=Helianthus annuus TaxID=4232 RepID=A0A251U653_HELAN|nr:D-galacturonate reductase [Helianthus annuus]KAF5795389.1 putative D-galacturonate reductase [Helianthus annuus]
MVSIPETTINSSDGRRPIPLIGLGTATRTESGDQVKAAVIEAIKVGYRHFDTASLYGTEKPLGEAIKEALRLGLIKSRAELFITTKLWCDSTEGHLVVPALNQSLRELGLEYVDLYLIHWPLKLNQDDAKSPITKESIAAINIKDVWEGMEKCQNLGLTKSIGVSNFYPRLIEELLSIAKIPPVVNQVEMNPLWQQKKLNDFCKKKDILLTGYSPLGAYNTVWGHNRVMECDVLQDIAKSRGKTVAQVSLRWMYEQGVSFVVKSFNIERMKQNLDIFEWSLTEEEVIKISRIPQQRHVYLSGTMLKEPHDVLAEIDAGLSY